MLIAKARNIDMHSLPHDNFPRIMREFALRLARTCVLYEFQLRYHLSEKLHS